MNFPDEWWSVPSDDLILEITDGTYNDESGNVSLENIRNGIIKCMEMGRTPSFALEFLDKVLIDHATKYCDGSQSMFLEAGANNGVSQSNTALLEYFFRWRGILIEPIHIMADLAAVCRPNSIVIHGALVPSSYDEKLVYGPFSDSVAADGAGLSLRVGLTDNHKETHNQYMTQVPAIHISTVLNGILKPETFGLLSLDIEGGEFEILKDIDYNVHRPKIIVVEAQCTQTAKEIEIFFKTKDYFLSEKYRNNDYIYVAE